MTKKNFISSLPFKLFLALLIGIIFGFILSEFDGNLLCKSLLNIVVTIKYIAGQFINFCVPLIIIGFVAPSISRLGAHASKILTVALIIAYVSSVGAAFLATTAGYFILPFMKIISQTENLKQLPQIVFELTIPQVIPVMSSLFL